jgi:hypothetical protein
MAHFNEIGAAFGNFETVMTVVDGIFRRWDGKCDAGQGDICGCWKYKFRNEKI